MHSQELNSILRRSDYDYSNTTNLMKDLRDILNAEQKKSQEDIDLGYIDSAITDLDNAIVVISPKIASCEIFKSTFDDIITSFEEGQEFARKIAKDYNLPEDELLEKHKQDFIEKLKDRELGLEATLAGGNKLSEVFNKFSKTNYPKYPEITTIYMKDFFSHYLFDGLYENGMTKNGRHNNYELFCSITNFLENPTPQNQALCDDIKDMMKQDHRVITFALQSSDSIDNGASTILKEIFYASISKMQNDPSEAQKYLSKSLDYGSLSRSNLGDYNKPTDSEVADLVLMHMQTFINHKIPLGIELEQLEFTTSSKYDRDAKMIRIENFKNTSNSKLYSWMIPEVIFYKDSKTQKTYNENIDILNKISLESVMNKRISEIAQNNKEETISHSNSFKL